MRKVATALGISDGDKTAASKTQDKYNGFVRPLLAAAAAAVEAQ